MHWFECLPTQNTFIPAGVVSAYYITEEEKKTLLRAVTQMDKNCVLARIVILAFLRMPAGVTDS